MFNIYMISSLKKYPKLIFDIFDTPIATGFAFALWAVPFHLLFNIRVVEDDYENIKQFIEWFGVPYGLLIALVLVSVWTQFDVANRSYDKEADAILAFYNTFLLISNNRLKIRATLLLSSYVDHIINRHAEECNNITCKRQGDDILNSIRDITGKVIRSKTDKELGFELLRLTNELIDDRGDRISYSKQRMPSTVMALALIASGLWLAPFFALDFDNIFLEVFFLAGVILIVVSIILIIVDLDNPIGGTWGIDLESWEELTKIII